MGATGPGADCTTCIDDGDNASERARLLADCRDSPPCTTFLNCARGCSDADCLDDCDAANPDVAPYRYAIYEALCASCSTQCASLAFCDRGCVDDVNLPVLMTAPATLAETGLYASGTAAPSEVAPYVRGFQPEYELWSDGAAKRRWAYIPKCERIGTEGINHWIFPVGTRMWKEFAVPGTGSAAPTRVETRMLTKYDEDPNGTFWLYATYQWPADAQNATAASAVLVTAGVMNANGTNHDIPAVTACPTCHGSLVEKVLGFSAIQLSHNLPGVNIRQLADAGWLTHPRSSGGRLARDGFDPPGTETDQRALGYLHANCGNCHHMGTLYGENTAANLPAARMRLMVGMDTLQATDTYTSLVDKPTLRPFFNGCDRIDPGYASHSEIIMRMNRRDAVLPGQQMPPLATEVIHMDAVAALSNWIDAMPSTGAPTCVPPTN
jgi:cytochrome c553